MQPAVPLSLPSQQEGPSRMEKTQKRGYMLETVVVWEAILMFNGLAHGIFN